MTDSPARYPSNPAEQPILDELFRIRNHLELMSTDKSCFIKAQDVKQCYDDIIPQVHALNDLRAGNLEQQTQQTQVDVVLDDCFQLISLAFLTIGKNSELPAIYSVVSTIKRVLDHLQEAAFCTRQDLKGCQRHLKEYRETLQAQKDKNDPHIVTHLESRITACEQPLEKLMKIMDLIPADLMQTYERNVSILRLLCSFNLRSKFPQAEVDQIVKELKEMQQQLGEPDPLEGNVNLAESVAQRIQENLSTTPTDGRQLVTDLLARNVLWSQLMQRRPAFVAEGFRLPFKKLMEIRNNLERRYLVQTWSIRETDLYLYQRQLNKFDNTRNADGDFVDALGKPADLQTQRTLLYLLRKSYVLIYRMLTSSQPVSEALIPIYNQLKTLILCLKEVDKAGGVSSPRELYPYSMKLASIQNLQTDGVFIINDEIPDGQDVLRALLSECSQTLRELAESVNSTKRTDSEENLAGSSVSLRA